MEVTRPPPPPPLGKMTIENNYIRVHKMMRRWVENYKVNPGRVPLVPPKNTIGLSASIAFKMVDQSEYALGL